MTVMTDRVTPKGSFMKGTRVEPQFGEAGSSFSMALKQSGPAQNKDVSVLVYVILPK